MTSPVPVAVPPTLPRHPKGLKVDLHASSTSAPAAPATTRPQAVHTFVMANESGTGPGSDSFAPTGNEATMSASALLEHLTMNAVRVMNMQGSGFRDFRVKVLGPSSWTWWGARTALGPTGR